MNNKKLKQTSLANLLAGYVLSILFIVLILLNIKKEEMETKEEVITAVETQEPEELSQEKIFNGISPNHVYYNDVPLNTISTPRIIREPEVLIETSLPINKTDTVIYGHKTNRDLLVDEVVVDKYNGNTVGLSESGTVGVSLHRGSGFNGKDFQVDSRGGDVDIGLLDRRLAELDNENIILGDEDLTSYNEAIAKDKDKIGIKTKDEIDMSKITLARDNDIELGEIDLDFDKNNGKEYGVGKGGELYAYNYPSRGVGAGIGSSAIGAGAGGGAGLGAGIGEGILNGETVPTLGGVGTSRLVPANLEVTAENDKDGDGLPAITESQLGTNPNNADTDGDGVSDGEEVSQYSNPLNKSSTPDNPGNSYMAKSGGVGGLLGGAGAGGAAGLTQGYVVEKLGLGMGPGKGYGGSGKGYGRGYKYDHLPKNGALNIMIHVDGSGSILATRKQLEIMKDTLLKEALLPYYNNDENLYNKRVSIIDSSGERTLKFYTEAAQKDNVLAIAFQDEAAPDYHLPNFNKVPQGEYSYDLKKLKHLLLEHKGLYRGIMFQVDRGRVFSKAFKEMVHAAWNGEGYLAKENLKKYHRDNNQQNIQHKKGIVFSDEYHAQSEGDPQYYLNLIFEASKRVGIDLDIYGGGLKDGKYNNK